MSLTFASEEGHNVKQTFTSCSIGVCTSLEAVRNHTIFQFIDKPISNSAIYNWGPVVTRKDRAMFSLKVSVATPTEERMCDIHWLS